MLQILDDFLYVGYACGVYGYETCSLSLELGRDENCLSRIMDKGATLSLPVTMVIW